MMRLFERVLTIPPAEASFESRGFEPGDPVKTRNLEKMLGSFIAGYNLAVRTADPNELKAALHAGFDSQHVGFAFEGTGLYFALLDLVLPGKPHRLADFMSGAGREHDFIIAVGAGFAIPRVPWGRNSMDGYLRTIDPFIGWCIPGGYGFHEGFFKHKRFVEGMQEPPAALGAIGKRLFDSGLGRSMWWVLCSDPARIGATIARFPESRRPELWAGIGIAACYAGGINVTELLKLQELSGSYQADLLSGLPIGARLRQKAGNYSDVTEMACRTLLSQSTDRTADMAEEAADAVRSQVHGQGITAAYDLVRQYLVREPRILAKAHDKAFTKVGSHG